MGNREFVEQMECLLEGPLIASCFLSLFSLTNALEMRMEFYLNKQTH